MIIRENVSDFVLDHIFDCGQCFRWDKQSDGSYTGIACAHPVNISFAPYKDGTAGKLVIDNASEKDFETVWKRYLDLDRDYEGIKKDLALSGEIMANAIACGHGMRILQQEKWETLISFIISQNNNISRIKKCIALLCENFGAPAEVYRGRQYYQFPEPEILAGLSLEDLASCRLGYRARYLIETARAVCADNGALLSGMSDATMDEAYAYLTSLSGVGPKVANCIMLFSMGKYASFPIDVWVKRVMSRLYGIDENNFKAMTEYASKNFGAYGGFAQQYLFYYMKSL